MDNDLLGGLGSNTPKLLDVFHFLAKLIFELYLGVEKFRFNNCNLSLLIFHFLNHGAKLKDLDLTELFVIAHLDIPPGTELLFGCRLYCLFNGLNQKLFIKTTIPADLIDDAF